MTMKKILILNGPNLNLQGTRDVGTYGTTTFDDYMSQLRHRYEGRVELDYYQSNIEGELINTIHRSVGRYDGIVLNAGGYTHTSVARRHLGRHHTRCGGTHIVDTRTRGVPPHLDDRTRSQGFDHGIRSGLVPFGR